MTQQSEFKRGWPIVAAAAVGIGLGISPLPFYTIDVMVEPLSNEFGWSRSQVFSAVVVWALSALVTAPAIGILTEKFGARRIGLSSLVLFSFSMMGLGLNNGNQVFYIALWSIMALAGMGTFPVVLTKPVNNWFDKKRGLALGIALITTGVFGSLSKAYAQSFVDLYGWRMAYVAIGALPLTIAFPFAFLALRDVNDKPYHESVAAKFKPLLLGISLLGTCGLVYFSLQFFWPQFLANGWQLQYAMAFVFMAMVLGAVIGAMFIRFDMTLPTREEGAAKIELLGLTLKETFRSWRFWLLGLCFLLISYAIGAMIPSIVPLLGSKGYTTAEAVSLATLIGLAVFFGRLIGGYLIDKFWAPLVAFALLSLPALALLMLRGDVSQTEATIAILMIGFGAGVEYDFLAFLVSKYFGMKNYSAVYGALYAFFAAGAGTGPSIINSLADSRGWDYTLLTAAIALIAGTIPLLALGKYREFKAA